MKESTVLAFYHNILIILKNPVKFLASEGYRLKPSKYGDCTVYHFNAEKTYTLDV